MGNTFGRVAASFGKKRKQPSSRGGQSVDKGTCSVHADIEAERLLNPLADNGKDDDVIIRRQKRARTDGPGAASTFTCGLPDDDNLNATRTTPPVVENDGFSFGFSFGFSLRIISKRTRRSTGDDLLHLSDWPSRTGAVERRQQAMSE